MISRPGQEAGWECRGLERRHHQGGLTPHLDNIRLTSHNLNCPLSPGDILCPLSLLEPGWWVGEVVFPVSQDRRGLTEVFPANYVCCFT